MLIYHIIYKILYILYILLDEDTIYCVKQNRKATIKGNKSCTELQTTCRNSICSEPVQSTHEGLYK